MMILNLYGILFHAVVVFGLKDDVHPKILFSLKRSPPKANGQYQPLAISFSGYWIPWSNIGIRSPKANGHQLPLAIALPLDIVLP